jgi:hypothetical protein
MKAAAPARGGRGLLGIKSTRLIVALVVGLFLGLFGLPRLSPQLSLPPAGEAAPTIVPTQVRAVVPTLVPTVEPTRVPTPSVPPIVVGPASRTVLAQHFLDPLDGWPNASDGTAWFANGRYEIMARDAGRHVAIGAPIDAPVGDVVVSGRFRKIGGPPGGGYGFIVRDQSLAPLDGEWQAGQYIVLEVGDKGDVGIWQREDTHWIDMLPWSHSLAVRRGDAPNDLAVATQGYRLQFLVNGGEVANLTYRPLPPSGRVGIFVGGDGNQVAVDWFLVESATAATR